MSIEANYKYKRQTLFYEKLVSYPSQGYSCLTDNLHWEMPTLPWSSNPANISPLDIVGLGNAVSVASESSKQLFYPV